MSIIYDTTVSQINKRFYLELGTPANLTSLPIEISLKIFDKRLSIKDLCHLREVSNDLKSAVDEFVKNVLIRLNTQGPSILKNFLATQKQPITSTNAWTILGLFKKAYPFLRLDTSIQSACEHPKYASPATLALRDALVLLCPEYFTDLGWEATAEGIRYWLTHKENHTLLERVVDLNLRGKGLSEVPQELRFLPGLRSIDLSNNNIRAIDTEIFAFNPKLEFVYLEGNKITSIPANPSSKLKIVIDPAERIAIFEASLL